MVLNYLELACADVVVGSFDIFYVGWASVFFL